MVLEKTLESPLDCKEIQPVHSDVLKEISPECSLEGLMLKLKLQYLGHLMQRTNSFEKTLMLGKIEGRRSPASSVLAREGAGCGSVGDVPGTWLASAPLWPSLWT